MTEHLVRDVRQALNDPRDVAQKLGFKIEQFAPSYVLVLCPVHDEHTGSCSIHRRGDTLAVRCHGCDWSGDVLHLIAVVHGLDMRGQFPEVLATAAELAGYLAEAEELRGGKRVRRPVARREPLPEPEPSYPPLAEVERLWLEAAPVTDDTAASGALVARRIDPALVAEDDLARVIQRGARLPKWARYRGKADASRPWTETGHRMIVPAYDSGGTMRSVRAWRVDGDDSAPKRVPPSGHSAAKLVLANGLGVHWLRGKRRPGRIVIVEGEPDMLARSIASPGECIIGVLSGSWHAGFSSAVPYGSEVVIRTHLDDAGNRYAAQITESVMGRALVRRWATEEGSAA